MPTDTTTNPLPFRPLQRRGRVILAVLQVLVDNDQSLHGYKVARLAGTLPGSAYLSLQRLVGHGWATSHWEDLDPDQPGMRRRLYQLTPEGTKAAHAALDPTNPVKKWR